MNDSTSLLSAQSLTIGYAGHGQAERTVAQSLTLDLKPGQLVCLLGPNGAGKSTLMRTLSGLQPSLNGQILLAGELINQLSPTELARTMSVVLSERVDAGNLLVSEIVALGRTPYTGWLGKLTPPDHAKVKDALQATDTLRFAHRRLQQLSDGERQKVMLARALAQDTALILLDEPTAHLDLPNRVDMMRLLHQLTRQTGKAILMSTHELDLALQAADRLWLLDATGHLTSGSPEDLVLTGAFEKTFNREGFSFDRMTGTFSLRSVETGEVFTLVGDEPLLFWTRRAMLREGFLITKDSLNIVEAVYEDEKPTWYIRQHDYQQSFSSVAELLASLQIGFGNKLANPYNVNETTREKRR